MDFKEKLIESFSAQDQRVIIKYLTLQGKYPSQIQQGLKNALGCSALSLRTVERWHSRFKKGEASIEEARGRPSEKSDEKQERIEAVKEILLETKAISVRLISERLNITKSSVHLILTDDLKLSKRHGCYIPMELNEDQKDHRVQACVFNLTNYRKTKEKLKRTLTFDETWVGLYMAPQKDQLMSWLEPGEKGQQVAMNKRYGG